jgi:hypothetical protein
MTANRLARYFGLTLLALVAVALTLFGMSLCFYPMDPATATFSDRATALVGLLMVSGGCGAAIFNYRIAFKSGDAKALREFLALILGIAAVFGAALVISNLVPVSKYAPQVPDAKQIPAGGLWLALAAMECAGTLAWLIRAEKMKHE